MLGAPDMELQRMKRDLYWADADRRIMMLSSSPRPGGASSSVGRVLF